MINRSLAMTCFFLLVCLTSWVSGALAQEELRFERYSPQIEIHWKEMLKSNPRDAKAFFGLGRYYELVERNPESAENYRQATMIDPGWSEAFFLLGKAYWRLQRYQEAAAALQRATILKSNYGQAYHYLALVKIHLERHEEAAEALIKSYNCNPGWAETYYDHSPYGVHAELGVKTTVLQLIKYIYPVNQHLARILYNQWARNDAGMKEYWETVSGRTLPGDKGYQKGIIHGYQGPDEMGYQNPAAMGFQRTPNQPSAPEHLAD